jgi:hypothetical protein
MMKQDEHSHRDGAARSRHARSQALVAPSDANARRLDGILSDPIPPINESDLRLFRIFRAVAEAGGLAAAEIKLGMDRSSISRQLSALETRLNARLCFRGPSGFELTEFGRQALRAAIHAQDTLEMIGHKLNEARTMMSGDLYIGIADNCLTNPRCALVQALSEFRRLAPNVTGCNSGSQEPRSAWSARRWATNACDASRYSRRLFDSMSRRAIHYHRRR